MICPVLMVPIRGCQIRRTQWLQGTRMKRFEEAWLVSFMNYDLGFFDRELNKVQPVGKNPFAQKMLPMLPE